MTTTNAAKPYCVVATAKLGKLKNRNCLISGHDTMAEAQWVANRLNDLFGIDAEACSQ